MSPLGQAARASANRVPTYPRIGLAGSEQSWPSCRSWGVERSATTFSLQPRLDHRAQARVDISNACRRLTTRRFTVGTGWISGSGDPGECSELISTRLSTYPQDGVHRM